VGNRARTVSVESDIVTVTHNITHRPYLSYDVHPPRGRQSNTFPKIDSSRLKTAIGDVLADYINTASASSPHA
jgi:hypothetical protein